MFTLKKSFEQIKSFMLDAGLVESTEKDDNDDAPEEKTEEQVAREEKTAKNRIQKARKRENLKVKKQEVSFNPESAKRGVVMIKDFPHGFYETEMKKFFSQFGDISRLKIVRSRKTGRPRNYGFIEFKFHDVAVIAAETMDRYMMFDKVLRCKVLPEDKVPDNLFQNWNRPFVSSLKLHKDQHNSMKSEEKEYQLLKRRLSRLENQKNKLSELGIEFECCVVNRPVHLEKTVEKKEELSKVALPSQTSKFPSVEMQPKLGKKSQKVKSTVSQASAPKKLGRRLAKTVGRK